MLTVGSVNVTASDYFRIAQFSQKSKSHLKILGARTVTWIKRHIENPQILGNATQPSRHGDLASRIRAAVDYTDVCLSVEDSLVVLYPSENNKNWLKYEEEYKTDLVCFRVNQATE
jgi:hypothetical protein